MHFYRLFGLNFQSDFRFPFLNESHRLIPDVRIIFGKIPEKLDKIKNKGVLFQANDDEFIFWINSVGKYYIKNGNIIIIEKNPVASNKDLFVFMTGSVLGALFQQRNILAFHGCTVEKNGKSFLFLGRTGSGKSTMGLFFYKNGYNIVSDDISIIKPEANNTCSVESGPPYLKIWLDTLHKYNLHDLKLEALRDNIHKYVFPVSGEFKSASIDSVYLLNNNHHKTGIEFTELKGVEKFNTLLRNIYKRTFAKNTVFEQKSFSVLTKFASLFPLEVIEREQDRFCQEDIFRMIEKKVSG